jgi:hypothetical protein
VINLNPVTAPPGAVPPQFTVSVPPYVPVDASNFNYRATATVNGVTTPQNHPQWASQYLK